MKLVHRHLLTLIAAASLAACSSVKLDDTPVESKTGTPVGANSGGSSGSGNGSATRVASVDVSDTGSSAMSNLPKVVYFDYDSYIVKDEFDQRTLLDTVERLVAH